MTAIRHLNLRSSRVGIEKGHNIQRVTSPFAAGCLSRCARQLGKQNVFSEYVSAHGINENQTFFPLKATERR